MFKELDMTLISKTACHKTRAYEQLGGLNYCPYFNVDKGDNFKIQAYTTPLKKFFCLYSNIVSRLNIKIRAVNCEKCVNVNTGKVKVVQSTPEVWMANKC